MEKELKDSILKTGTTILGIVCKDGVVMASDRQATLGSSIVGNKRMQKTVIVNDFLAISGCGVGSDVQKVPTILGAELRLRELSSRKKPTIKQAANLLKNMSYSGIRQPSMIPQQAGFLIGGFNEDGTTELYDIGVDGAIDLVKDYSASIGSGMPYVLGLLERQYKPGMTIKEGIELAKEALKSSTQRDIASGYGIDIFSITKQGIKKEVEQTINPDFKDDKKE